MSSTRRRSLATSGGLSPLKTSASSKVPSSSVDISLKVPTHVTDMAKTFFSKIWNSSCPFASLFVWSQVLMSIYYLFLMPDVNVYLDQNQVKAVKVSRSIRGWLFIVSVACGIVGYMIISQGCEKAGSQWSILWFLAALVVTWLVNCFILAGVERSTLSCSSDFLKQMSN